MTTAAATVTTVTTVRDMITSPATAAPADDLTARIGASDQEIGRIDAVATCPALGMEIAVSCVPSRSKTVLRALAAIADINEQIITASITESDAVVGVVELLARLDRNSKTLDVSPAPRLISEELDAALAGIESELAEIEAAAGGRTVTTSDGRYVVDLEFGTIRVSEDIPGSIAAIMPEMWASIDGVGVCPSMDIPEGWERAAEIELEAAERDAVEIMQILGIEES